MSVQLNTIYNEDCLETLKRMPDNFVDLVLTDPPYNIARNNNFQTMGRAGIDFGEWDKDADILSFIEPTHRVTKSGGSMVVFNDWKNLGDIAKEAERVGWITKDMLRLKKTNPMPRNRDRRYITDYECAIWFVKPKARWTFNRQNPSYQRPEFVYPIEKGLHPTQKNLDLMKMLLKIHSNEGDLVYDPFMGSGTTAKACQDINRNYIGSEISKEYCDIAEERLRKG